MRLLRSLFQFYVHSNIHVALAVGCLVLITGLFFKVDTSQSSLFIGVSTFVAYNWIRFLKYKYASLQGTVFRWFDSHKTTLFILNLLASVYLLIALKTMEREAFFVLLPFSVMTLLYITPVAFLKNKEIALRKIPGFKIFCIAVSWSGLVALFPLVQAGVHIGMREWLFFIQQFLFVFVLTLPFDLRDLNFDKKDLKTVPQLIGVKRSKITGCVLIVVYCVVSSFCFGKVLLLSVLVVGCVQVILLLKATARQSEYYASFWVEGLPILWLIILFFLQMFLK